MDFGSFCEIETKDKLDNLVQKYEEIESNICNTNLNNIHLTELFQCLKLVENILHEDVDYTEHILTIALIQFGTVLKMQYDNLTLLLEQRSNLNRQNVPSNEINNPKNSTYIDDIKISPTVNGLKEVAGLIDVKKELISNIILPIRQPQLFNDFQICKSILLYGPPGTGKTMLAHALAVDTNSDLYCISASNVLSSYIGESEKKLRNIFETVKKTENRSIIFIDEIDGLCRQRNDKDNDATRRFKTEIMCQLNTLEKCKNIYFFCATNCPWDLDSALIRRFHRKLYIPLPNNNETLEFLELFTKNTPLFNTKYFWQSATVKLNGYSGADIANVIRYALNLPLKELLDVKQWIIVDNKYKPADWCFDTNSTVVKCDIQDLPRNSVLARDPNYVDILTAISVIKKSTSEQQMKKYYEYAYS